MIINNINYIIQKDIDKAVEQVTNIEDIITEHFSKYDYIVCDIAYNKPRIKGFYEIDSKEVKKHNNIKDVENYISKKCAYGCKYFILKKIKL